VEKEVFAPFEIENGFAHDAFLKGEQSRAGEYQIKRRPSSQRETHLRTRAQWAERGRRVLPNVAPAKVLDTKNSHHLRLYSIEQTTDSIR
jgi:hypothetical protein